MAATALEQFRTVIDARPVPGGPTTSDAAAAWRWQVRRQLAAVRDTLLDDTSGIGRAEGWADSWLTARDGAVRRERDGLLARLGRLGPRVLVDPDPAALQVELLRLLTDVDHHLQRRRDLAWDEVELELGGSD